MRGADGHGGKPLADEAALPDIKALSPEAWVDAVRAFLVDRDDASEVLDALTAAGPYAWKGLLDLRPGGRLLCLGCGFGALAQNLAPHWDQLFLLDKAWPRLRFTQKRLAIFNPKDDITLLAGGADGRLPFAAESFDGVILADPEALADRRLLAEARRVLRAEGQLFILADNRFSLSLPVGWWDRWSAAPQPLSALARAAALVSTWWQRRNGERSLPGLCREVKRAGFTELQLFGLWPGRQLLSEIMPLQGLRLKRASGAPSSWRQRLKRRALFLPAHGLLAQAGGAARGSTYTRLFEQVARQLAGTEAEVAAPVRAERMIITRKDKMIVLAGRGDNRLVVRIPFGAAAAAAEERNAATLARLALSHPGLAPRVLAEGAVDGIAYRVESMMAGVPLGLVLKARGSGATLARVEALLEDLNPSAGLRPEAFEGARYERLVGARLERLFCLLPDDGRRQRVRDFFRARLHGAGLPFGLVHGDFSCSNIHLAGDRQAGIIDWEAAAFDDLTVLDAIGYLESVHRLYHPAHSLAESFPALAAGVFRSSVEKRFLFARYERLGVDPACHAALVYLRWLRLVDYLLPYWLRYHPGGQQRYIHRVVQALLEQDSALAPSRTGPLTAS